MARKITVNRFVEQLGRAVHRYAKRQGVGPGHYGMTAVYDPNLGRTYLNVATDVPIDDTEWSSGIREEIRKELGEVPDVTEFGLVVWQVDDLEIFFDSRIVSNEDLDLTELLSSHG